ncbi:MAG: DUF58 domain-containing protein [Planctomycetes bacterium]|nr:DUF58 domain-containing protein [Planctomycetota bacterium]MBI3833695.1 DUF58 domain-containing protein [Planctomycetota bacterium]
MIPKELLKKVRQIQIRTSRTVNDVLAGQYHSAFRGRGMEFEEVSPYVIGDDVRLIDWNVSARYGEPFIKKFREERELTVMLAVDVSRSGLFGSGSQFKLDVAAELCAVLAFSAIRSNDKVGLILFTDEVEKYVPAKKGVRHVLRIVRELLYHTPKGHGTDIAEAIGFANRVTTRKSVLFLVSDFLERNFEASLRIARRRHDLIPIVISDPRESELPRAGIVEIMDRETGETMLVDSSSRAVREQFRNMALDRLNARRTMFRRMDTETIEVSTDRPYVEAMVRFFHKRERRR